MHNAKTTSIQWMDVRILKEKQLFEDCFQRMSEERKKDILAKKNDEDRLLSLAGGILFDTLLKEKKIDSFVLHTNEHKPYIKNTPQWHISLSHSFPFAIAVIAQKSVGIDIESYSVDLEAVFRHFYTKDEQDYIHSLPKEIQHIKTVDFWCRKECYIKYDRPQDLREFSVIQPPKGYHWQEFPFQQFACQALLPNEPFSFSQFSLEKYL